MDLHLLHGVVNKWSRDLFTHRIHVSADSFRSYLESRPTKYASWTNAVPTGDVMTIDDSTKGGAEACLLARALGHEVIFFVNPLPIITGAPYFFSYLDAYIDDRKVQSVDFDSEHFDFADPGALRKFRKRVKLVLMVKPASQSLAEVASIGQLLGAEVKELPAHLHPINLEDLIRLRDAGVQIGNHGWSHIEVSGLSVEEFSEHITSARDWFKRELSLDPFLYACPFGETNVSDSYRHVVAGPYLLANSKMPSGQVSPNCWNRHDIAEVVRAF